MSYGYKSFTVSYANGDAAENIPIYIYEIGTDTKATLYSSSSGGTISNPLQTDSNGVASCYLAAGFYDADPIGIGFQSAREDGFQISVTDAEGVQSVTGDTVLTASDLYTDCDCTAAGIAITLPPAASVLEAAEFGIKKIDSTANIVTITDPGGVTIEGSASMTLEIPNEGVWLAVRGGVWRKVGVM